MIVAAPPAPITKPAHPITVLKVATPAISILPSKASPTKVEAPVWHQLTLAAQHRLHMLLTGPRGTGKTHMVKELAKHLGRELEVVQCHQDLTIEELRGSPALRGGDSIFIQGPVLRAVEHGKVLLVDEFNLARPATIAWFNNILDFDGFIAVPEEQRSVPVHANFLAVFCCNEGYAGTREPNEAFKDRCRVIHCDYWPAEQELGLLKKQLPQVADIDARRMIAVANAVRAARKAGSVDFDFSIRTLRQWGIDAYERTLDLLESFRAVVLPKVGDPLLNSPQHEALLRLAQVTLSRSSF